jgi:hypothetical protein
MDLNDDEKAGYRAGVRPAVPARQCPDRQKALDEYAKASSWEETDKIERPKLVKGIGWDVVWFVVACVLGGMGVVCWVALQVMK